MESWGGRGCLNCIGFMGALQDLLVLLQWMLSSSKTHNLNFTRPKAHDEPEACSPKFLHPNLTRNAEKGAYMHHCLLKGVLHELLGWYGGEAEH